MKAKIESHIKNLEDEFNSGEGDREELENKILTVEEELSKFHEEELEYLEAGGDPLLTCLHCNYQFAHYTNYKQHKCKYVLDPSIQDKVEKFRVVGGKDRERFMESIKFMSKHRQIQCCVATRTACSSVFPLLFPGKGDKSVSMLEEVGLVGKEAYTALGRALQDGTLHLPTHIVLSLPEGGELYLPPAILTPTVCAEATSRWRSSLNIDICLEENTMDLKLAGIDEEEEEEEEEDDLLDDEDEDDNGQGVWWGQVGGGDGQGAGAGAGGGGRRQGRGRPTDQDREVSRPLLQTTTSHRLAVRTDAMPCFSIVKCFVLWSVSAGYSASLPKCLTLLPAGREPPPAAPHRPHLGAAPATEQPDQRTVPAAGRGDPAVRAHCHPPRLTLPL